MLNDVCGGENSESPLTAFVLNYNQDARTVFIIFLIIGQHGIVYTFSAQMPLTDWAMDELLLNYLQ